MVYDSDDSVTVWRYEAVCVVGEGVVVCDSVAVCGSVWQCVAVCGSVWQFVAVYGSV